MNEIKIMAELIITIQDYFEEHSFYDEDGIKCFSSVKNIKNIFEMDITPTRAGQRYAFTPDKEMEEICIINHNICKHDNNEWSVFWFLRKSKASYSYCLPMDLYYKIVKTK